MKKQVLILLSGLFLTVSISAADNPFESNTAAQAFHQNGTDSSPNPITPPTANNSNLPKNSIIEQQLDNEISQLNQNFLLYQQTMSQKIQELTNKNKELEVNLNKMTEVINLLNNQINDLKAFVPVSQVQPPKQALTLNYFIFNPYYVASIVLFVLMIFLIWFRSIFLGRSAIDSENEYDFMSSQEAIPAKLNLARAYHAMGDLKSAREVLEDVIKQGNLDQQDEARKLLLQY